MQTLRKGNMSNARACWVLIAGLTGSLLLACSDEAEPNNPGTSAGTGNSSGSSGSPSGGSTTGGSTGSGGSSAGTTSSGGGGTGGAATGGGGAASGGGGSSAGGGAGGGTGGTSAGSGGGGGTGGAAAPTAVANIMGVGDGAGKVMGTATFTQGATMTTLVLNLTMCPNGVHSSHLHEMNDCGNNGEAAGAHWANGEMLGDYTCADGKVMKEVSRPLDKWTVGGDSATDVTKHSFMVHAMSDAQGSGARIGCGTITKQ